MNFHAQLQDKPTSHIMPYLHDVVIGRRSRRKVGTIIECRRGVHKAIVVVKMDDTYEEVGIFQDEFELCSDGGIVTSWWLPKDFDQ